MTTSPEPQPEHPSTYVVADRSSADEMQRLLVLDRLFTESMGGVLPEQTAPQQFRQILDVGCATGGWLIDLAQALPDASLLVGVDVSKRMVDYARGRAKELKLDDRVEFHVMDALRMLEFPNATFDLVNQRLGMGYLRTWDWRKLLEEYRRVSRPGGTIRITEATLGAAASSPAFSQLSELMIQALYNAGHLFAPQRNSLLDELPNLLMQYGVKNVQTHEYQFEYAAGLPRWEACLEDTVLAFRTAVPFLRKWTRVPSDYEDIYQQMLRDFQQPDFRVSTNLKTAWGSK